MKLVVQGARLDPLVVEHLVSLTRCRTVRPVAANALALLDAQEDPAIETVCRQARLDCTWLPDARKLTDFGLFVTDMDSTLINIECIDEIADMQGLKPQVAAITEASMRGELDFTESLTRRVALLAGLPEQALADVYEQRLALNPGAEELLRTLREAGIYTMLVSGGFTYFTNRLKQQLGFDEAWANELEVVDGHLTGRVVGAVVDGVAKAEHLRHARTRLGLTRDAVIAVGDGANDLLMFQEAGFSVAYQAKPIVRSQASCRLDFSGLDGILNVLADTRSA
jgi:phosphoserine phosphatase